MKSLKISIHVLLYLVVVCPINFVYAKHGSRPFKSLDGEKENSRPCALCPRHGECVPRIQCPAHLRPGAYNPECHIGASGLIGVCCFTGSGHAAESDHKLRAASSLSPEDLKAAHQHSHQKLAQWTSKASELLLSARHTLVNVSSPSFAHHMSLATQDDRAEQLSRGALLNLFAAEHLKSRQALSDDEISLGFSDHTEGPYCPPPPKCADPPNRYRSISGSCNNPAFPSWGAVNTGFERLLPPDYSDGVWGMRSTSSGLPLPSPRAVSEALILEGSHPSPSHSLMFMQFGQFIAHDLSAGVPFTIGNGSAISCCTNDGQDFLPPELQHWGCAAIAADHGDKFFGQFGHRCLNFVRTQLAPAADCSVGYAKQMNGATHYPDLSHLYGFTKQKSQSLRAPGGLLDVFNDYGRELPPLTARQECLSAKDGAACFESGDNHGNQVISLTVLHTLWTREHNRIARFLSQFNRDWNEEKVFWETRRIVQAEYQHIIYNEWLPLLLGPQLTQLFNLAPTIPKSTHSSAYNPNVNPSLTTEFAAAAMRFGHSIVDGRIPVPNTKTGDMYETIAIPEVMFQPSRMRLRPFLDRVLTGLSWQPMQTVDPFVTEGLTRYLFHGGNPFGIDLAAINIQRGRDWGVRSYNEYLRLIGNEPYTDFGQYSPNTAKRLSTVYSTPEDVDLWIGGLLEEPTDGGVVGQTFAHIIADQFSRLKRGDRYFYEYGPDVNPGAFTPRQLATIKKATFARIICDNRDGIELVSQAPSAFLRADLPGNQPVPCDSSAIPALDLLEFA